MQSMKELRQLLESVNRKSYPAYKSTKGSYQFGAYVLHIDRVQGDPFAAPSRLRVTVKEEQAGFPAEFYAKEPERIALCDDLLRRFKTAIDQFSFRAKGSGKSGIITVSRCGQEVISRSACQVCRGDFVICFEVGFPARGRTIDATELIKILFDYLPRCVENSLYYRNLPEKEVKKVIHLARDQAYIRSELESRGLIAFVANGAILPRESGVSERPMKAAVPFQTPASMAVELELPNYGKLTGMGIAKGITLIAGGGYHGKSTLLKALERGVYNHIAGDGREYVITEDSALKIRAEDGRKISDVDISLFINHLPNGKDTKHFYTDDASGSTSQAANIIEGMESDSKILLIDEDTSATNLMIRDALMQRVITREQEPITPFLERAKALHEQGNVSTILVVGSSGAYFYIADKILQMDTYGVIDITERTKAVIAQGKAPATTAPHFHLPVQKRFISLGQTTTKRKNYRGDQMREERLKVKLMGKSAFSLGKEVLDLRYVEQLIDEEQTRMLAYLLRYIKEKYGTKKVDVKTIVEELWGQLQERGLSGVLGCDGESSGLAMVRKQEIYATLNRY